MEVPKNVMLTWKTKDIPIKWKLGYSTVRLHLRDWKIYFYDDEGLRNLVKDNFPEYLEAYDNFPYNIQRVDFSRYVWLYTYGGLYKDLDLVLKRDIVPFFEKGDLFLVSSGNIGSSLTNCIMASKPKHPFWIEMMEHAVKPAGKWAIGKHWKVMTTSGPMGLSKVARETEYSYVMLPRKLFLPLSVCDIGKLDPEDSYLRQLEGCSWISWDTEFYNFCICKWDQGIFLASIFIIFLFIIFLFLLYLVHTKR